MVLVDLPSSGTEFIHTFLEFLGGPSAAWRGCLTLLRAVELSDETGLVGKGALNSYSGGPKTTRPSEPPKPNIPRNCSHHIVILPQQPTQLVSFYLHAAQRAAETLASEPVSKVTDRELVCLLALFCHWNCVESLEGSHTGETKKSGGKRKREKQREGGGEREREKDKLNLRMQNKPKLHAPTVWAAALPGSFQGCPVMIKQRLLHISQS